MTNERLQQEIEERKQAQEVATRFVSMLSHEFRNPLAAIQSSAELLKKYGGRMTDERKCEHMDKIQVQVKQIVDLLDTILSVNANGNAALKFHPTPVDMPQFCAEILEEMELIHGGTHTLILNIDDQCHALLLDRWWLRHLLNNLLSNAIKYSPGGGAVYLNVMCRENTVMLCVRDEGMGIPKADYTRLFQRFQRGSNVGSIPGTGLGLSMVLQAVEAHGGSIDVESEIGQGSTFTVVLPAQQLETAPR
jgi:signal transduction histidine kinase